MSDPPVHPRPPASPSPAVPASEPIPIQALIDRPDAQRLKEHQYRFAQAVVFGLPVLTLQLFGHRLGGDEAARWVALLQGLLAGWVLYVGATGMMLEGVLTLFAVRGATKPQSPHMRFVIADFVVACVAVGGYGWSFAWLATIVVQGQRPAAAATLFHWVVILIAAWTGSQWFRLARKLRRTAGEVQPS